MKDFIALFAIIMNSLFHAVLTRNDLNKPIYLIRKLRLRSIINLEINKYYHLNDSEEIYKLAFKLFKQAHEII